MFFKKFQIILLCFFVLTPNLWACTLPAEPCAAVVPINSEDAGMTLVECGRTFYYLVPQGAEATFMVVWDPAAHNTGKLLQKDKYDWCTKAGIPFAPGTDSPNQYGYFPADQMAEFFEVKGKGNLIEAIGRAGLPTEDAFFPSLVGPYHTLSQFADPGEISTIGGQATDYPDTGLFQITDLSEVPLDSNIDDVFPDSRMHNDDIPINWNGDTIRVYNFPSGDRAIKISNTGLLIEDIEIEMSNIEVDSYKAHLVAGNVVVESAPEIPFTSNGRDGVSSPAGFSIKFFIPSYDGNEETSKIKFKVWAPAAGYEFRHLYWVWKESVYRKSSETRVIQEEVLDEDGNVVTPEITETRVVWKPDGTNLCSEQLMVKSIKDPATAGTTDFIVYDTAGPETSEFTIRKSSSDADTNFADDGETELEFTLNVADTNPWFSEQFAGNLGESNVYGQVPFPQSHDKVEIKVYYTYPVYEFTSASGLKMDDLRTGGYALADLVDPSNKSAVFKSFKYQTKWTWKEAEVFDCSIGTSNKTTGAQGKFNGSETLITGKIRIKQPKPWHQVNDESNPSANSLPKPVFKVMAISKDTAGHACMLYDQVVGAVNPDEISTTAEPLSGSDSQAFNPADGNVIPVGELVNKINTSIDKSRWSNLGFLKAKDTTAPEIQVVVFDTRTNKYHLYGCYEGTDAEFSKFGTENKTDYSNDPPYLGSKEDNITTGHTFENVVDINDLYDRYLSQNDAVSTVTGPDRDIGFVCQKNNRIVFYIRAFDNINTCDLANKFGIQSLDYVITDKDGALPKVSISPTDMLQAQEHVFRFDNVDTAPYNLKVTAKDFAGNERILSLNIAVMGRKLDIRTLEERRRRFYE